MSVTDSQLDDIMVALSDKTRRSILQRLFDGEARVTDLAAPYKMSLNSVSKHILILERAGLVTRRKAGREHYIKFSPQALSEAGTWIDGRQAQWKDSAAANDTGTSGNALDTYAALMNAKKSGKPKAARPKKAKKPVWKFWG